MSRAGCIGRFETLHVFGYLCILFITTVCVTWTRRGTRQTFAER